MKINFSKKELVLSCLWIAIVFSFLFFCRSIFLTVKQDDYNDVTAEFYEVDIAETTISQNVHIEESTDKLSFLVKNKSGTEQNISFHMLDANNSTVIAELKTMVPYKDGAEQVVDWEIGKDVQLPENVVVEIKETHVEDGIYVCVQNKSFGQIYMENENVIDAHIRMAVVYDVKYDFVFFFIVAFFLVSIGIMFILSAIKKVDVEKIFFFVAFFSGLLFVFITPFGQEPDGWVHFTRSMDVAEANLLLPFWDNNGSSSVMKLPENINDIGFRKINPDIAEGTSYMNNIKQLHFSENIIAMEGMGGFCSLFYLPQAIGICIAKTFGMTVYGYMLWGRIINLLAYVTLAYIGLKKMPVFKNIYMVIALLPMSIFQAASFSYDAVLCGLCFLFIGICFYYAYEKENLTWKDVLCLGVILALLLLCKYVYVCIGLLVFIIPMKKFGDTKNYWKSFGIALLPIIVMIGFVLMNSGVPVSAPANSASSEVAQISQLGYVLQNPMFAVKVFVRSCISNFNIYVEQLTILGWLNYSLGVLEYLIPIFMVVVAFLDTKEYTDKITVKDRIIYFATFVIVVSAGMMGLYLMDGVANPVGEPIIRGYQGRYTIPVLMLLLTSLPSKNVENKIGDFSHKVVGTMALALAYSSIMVLYKCY